MALAAFTHGPSGPKPADGVVQDAQEGHFASKSQGGKLICLGLEENKEGLCHLSPGKCSHCQGRFTL